MMIMLEKKYEFWYVFKVNGVGDISVWKGSCCGGDL